MQNIENIPEAFTEAASIIEFMLIFTPRGATTERAERWLRDWRGGERPGFTNGRRHYVCLSCHRRITEFEGGHDHYPDCVREWSIPGAAERQAKIEAEHRELVKRMREGTQALEEFDAKNGASA